MQEWQRSGCCGAPDKESCARPPCPCNLSAYSPDEIRDIELDKTYALAFPYTGGPRKFAVKPPVKRYDPWSSHYAGPNRVF